MNTTVAIVSAVATIFVGIAGGVFTYATARANNRAAPYAELAKDVVNLRTDVRKLIAKVDALESRDRRWEAFYDDLTIRWMTHRTNPAPPARPAMSAIPTWEEL